MIKEESRYLSDPKYLKGQKDIVDFILDINDKVVAQETAVQAGHTAVEDGNFTVRNGDIIVSESDDTIVLRILHGAIPEIQLYPLGETDTHRVSLFGFDFEVGAGADQAMQLCIETSDANQDGGKLLLTREIAVLSHQPAVGNESLIWFNAHTSTPEIIFIKGRWPNQFQFDANQAVYPGTFEVPDTFSTWSHSYFSSFSTTTVPVISVVRSGSTFEWVLDSQSNSQFTVRFSSSTGSKIVNFWSFRL